MGLIKFPTHYQNPLPQTHTKLGTGEYIRFPYIKLLASDQGCKKQNTFIVSDIYLCYEAFTYIYFVTFSPISDTSPLLSWIIEKKLQSITCQHCIWSHSPILLKLWLKVQLDYNVLATFLQVLSTLLSFRHYPKS